MLDLNSIGSDPKYAGWFNMEDPAVAKYVNGVGRSVYIAQLMSLDENLGKVFEKLKNLGLYEDSTIVFTTDNGGNIVTYASSKSL